MSEKVRPGGIEIKAYSPESRTKESASGASIEITPDESHNGGVDEGSGKVQEQAREKEKLFELQQEASKRANQIRSDLAGIIQATEGWGDATQPKYRQDTRGQIEAMAIKIQQAIDKDDGRHTLNEPLFKGMKEVINNLNKKFQRVITFDATPSEQRSPIDQARLDAVVKGPLETGRSITMADWYVAYPTYTWQEMVKSVQTKERSGK